MRVLVTGGAGLVGTHAVEYYALKGHDVIAFDNLKRSELFGQSKKTVGHNWKYLEKYPNVSLVKGDVRSEEDILGVIKGVDAVIHAAAQPGVPSSSRIPREDFTINAYGTLNVLEALRVHAPGAVFIYCSTNKVYGENVDKYALDELDTRYSYRDIRGVNELTAIDHTGHTLYGVSKYAGDLYTQEYARLYGMRTAVFRMSCVYGVRQFGFEDQGWVAWFVIAALLNEKITVFGNGKQVRDLLYVEDLIKAFDLFVKSDIQHAVFNMGGGQDNTISLLEFIELLEKEAKVKLDLTFSQWRPLDQKVYISDINKAKEQLHWQPNTSIVQGVRRLLQWATQNKSLFS